MSTESVEPEYWLSQVMYNKLEEYHGHLLALENAIRAANKWGKPVMDRRKLKRLCSGEDVALRASELRELDRFLDAKNSLCARPILDKPINLLGMYRDIKDVCVLVATKYNDSIRSDTISRNDVRALRALMGASAMKDLRMEIEDIFHHGENERKIKLESWNKRLKSKFSLISLGSPFICHATERLLAVMFQVPPFKPPATFDTGLGIPCYLVWPRLGERQYIKNSAFLMDLKTVKSIFPGKTKNMKDDNRAIVVGQNVYVSKRIGLNHGLLVVQRQPNGKIFVVICGTYGPTTFGMARLISKPPGIPVALPPFKPGKIQPVVTAVIETTVKQRRPIKKSEKEARENRKMVDARLLSPVLSWERRENRWVSTELT